MAYTPSKRRSPTQAEAHDELALILATRVEKNEAGQERIIGQRRDAGAQVGDAANHTEERRLSSSLAEESLAGRRV